MVRSSYQNLLHFSSHCLASIMKIPLQILIVTAYGAWLTVADTVNITRNEIVCKGATARFTCVTETNAGLLIWRTNEGDEAIFSNLDIQNTSRNVGNFTFRLFKIMTTLKGHHRYYSTAEVRSVMQMTWIECGYTPHFVRRKVIILSVPMPNWTICTFTLDSMTLSWNHPAGGEQCCKKYVLHELKPCTPDTQSACMASVYEIVTNRFNVDESRYTLPLSESRYRVQCLNNYGNQSPFSIPLYIQLETPIEIYAALKKIEGDDTEYLVAWRGEKSMRDKGSSYAVCIPPVKSATVVCSSNSVNDKTKRNQDEISNCFVPRNESFTAMVEVINMAGFRSNESVSTDVSASIYQELQQEIEKRENVTQDLENCLANQQNSTNSPSTCAPCDSSGLNAFIIIIIGLSILLIFAICIIIILAFIAYRFYKKQKSKDDAS